MKRVWNLREKFPVILFPKESHDYDDVIVDIFNQYGSCLLYKYTDKDTYWTHSDWMNGVLWEEGKMVI